jgi:hypothetical protein
MSVKKQYEAFRAEGWKDLFNKNPERKVTIHMGSHAETFSVHEAREIIEEIKKAIKKSKKYKENPFY